MNLARHSISATTPVQVIDARFSAEHSEIFTTSTASGWAVYNTWPLKLLRKRELPNGTLAMVLPLYTSSLLFLLGGGPSPLYPPNKVVIWDDAAGKEVAELEFRERVRGMACRRGWLAVALRRRVAVFQITDTITRFVDYDTCDNETGLVAIATAPHSTLLAFPGRHTGHVHLVHLPPCPPPPGHPVTRPPPARSKAPQPVLIAHNSALASITVPPSGRLVATTSSKGTLLRIWDAHSGALVREFRRGTDQAKIYGVAFRPDESEVCVWSDKGTVHVFQLSGDSSATSNRQSTLSRFTPYINLPKYFTSEWSYAQYRLPTLSSHIALSSSPARGFNNPDLTNEERCVVGWIEVPPPDSAASPPTSPVGKGKAREKERKPEYQLIALTYTGGWYRLSLPSSTSSVGPVPSAYSSGDVPGYESVRSGPISIPNAAHKPPPSTIASSTLSSTGDRSGKESRPSGECGLEEFRRFGRWDGWG